MATPNNEKYDADSIRQQTDLLELASRYVQLKKEGAEYVGLCPFHSDTTPPGNFKVNPQKQVWACFACCAHEELGADAIGFLMKAESIEFPEACRRLLNGSGTSRPQIPVAQREPTKPPPRITCPPPNDAPPPPLTHRKFGEPSGTWTYRTADGALWGYVCRWDTDTGKEYRPITWGKQGDLPAGWERKHFHDSAGLRPIYGLDRLAANPNKQILICEGEKAADAAQQLFPGFVAISWPGGANACNHVDWCPLDARKVVLWPDNDEPGITAMGKLAQILGAIASEIKGLRVTDMPPGWDAADMTPDMGDPMTWAKARVFTYENDVSHGEIPPAQHDATPDDHEIPLEAYSDADTAGTPEQSRVWQKTQRRPPSPIVDGLTDGGKVTAASLGVVSRRMSDVQIRAVEWLWQGKIPCGKVTGISGNPGLGKSQITASLAAVVSVGGKWPVTRDQAPLGSVLLLNAEDDADDTLGPRLIAAGADLSRIHIIDAVRQANERGDTENRGLDLVRDLERIAITINEIGDVKLVIIDPVSAYMGAADSHKMAEVVGIMARLKSLASATRCAVIMVNHLNKSAGQDALLKTQGSIGFVSHARAVWGVCKDKDDPQRRYFLPLKNNLGSDAENAGLSYSIEEFHLTDSDPLITTSRIMWDADPVLKSAQELMSSDDNHERGAIDDAEDFLRDALAMGWTRTAELQLSSRKAGHSWATICRAKTRLKIKATRQGGMASSGAWGWDLPVTADRYRDQSGD